MDNIDYKIIEILRNDSRSRFVDIAKRLSVSEGTVRNRVQKMTDNKIIESFTIKCKHGAEGIVLIKSKSKRLDDVISMIWNFSDEVFEVSGEYDIACIIYADTIEALNRKINRIRALKNVLSTVTAIKLSSIRGRKLPL